METYATLTDKSRVYHKKLRKNIFYRQRIPWKTILLSFLFFIGGTIFLLLFFEKWNREGFTSSYEFLLLGMIMFIPGSYHTFIAYMAYRRKEGYSFSMVSALDDDDPNSFD